MLRRAMWSWMRSGTSGRSSDVVDVSAERRLILSLTEVLYPIGVLGLIVVEMDDNGDYK
jgi:hypothetical protein